MTRRFSLISTLIVALVIAGPVLIGTLPTSRVSLASDQPKTETLLHVTLDASAAVLPGPATWRLLRITVDSGAGAPLAAHSGILLWRVESGTVRVMVQGKTLVARAKAPDTWKDAAQSSEFSAKTGDVLVFFPGTAMQYTNASKRSVRVLAAIITPRSADAPPSISYVNGDPPADAFQGITPQILADGLTGSIPDGGVTIAIDEIELTSGQSLPASSAPTFYSVVKGSIKFKVISGRVQVFAGTQTIVQAIDEGTTVTVKRGGSAFFLDGVAETPRGSALADVTLLRWTTVSTEGASTDPGAEPATIKITGPRALTLVADRGTPNE